MKATELGARVETESDYRRALRVLNEATQGRGLLRLVMRGLEGYRSKRKIGWSRSQNKQGLVNFAAFRLELENDKALLSAAHEILRAPELRLAEPELMFVKELLSDPSLMGFLFVHDLTEIEQGTTQKFEGATLSFGRRHRTLGRHRDRVDLILESEVRDGSSFGLTRCRAYIDPFVQPIAEHPAVARSAEAARISGAPELFSRLSELYVAWSAEPGRPWRHWTQHYIDYFGERRVPVASSFFPAPIDGLMLADAAAKRCA